MTAQARSIRTAKFTFWPPPEMSTPTTRPWRSIAGPPELPGFAAASVWMSRFVTRLTTPLVTVPSSPYGLPTRISSSPGLAFRRRTASARAARLP